MPSRAAAHPLRRVKESLRAMKERHAVRHRSTGFGFVLADRVDFLDGERWDSLSDGQTLWLRRDVLRVLEQHGPKNIVPRYAMIFHEAEPVALLAAQIATVTADRVGAAAETRDQDRASKSLLKRMITPAKTLAVKRVNQRVLVAGNLMCWGFHGIAIKEGLPAATVWPGIVEALYRIRRAERLQGQANFVMIKDFTPAQAGFESLREFSYRPLETEPNMVLDLPANWSSYEDYLQALDSKYRSNAKSQIKKLTAGGCVVERLKGLDEHASALHRLYLNVQRNASLKLVTMPEGYLPALSRALGDDFRCHIVRRGEEVLGFITTLRDGDTAIAYYIGFDHEAAREGLPIYLRLLHTTIGDALDWRCKRLSLGRTALEPKAALGAKPEAMSVWMRHRIPVLNWMLRGVLDAVPHNEPPERSPFKAIK